MPGMLFPGAVISTSEAESAFEKSLYTFCRESPICCTQFMREPILMEFCSAATCAPVSSLSGNPSVLLEAKGLTEGMCW